MVDLSVWLAAVAGGQRCVAGLASGLRVRAQSVLSGVAGRQPR